ncbi:MAG: asparagine synthase (glutamine-hydrolyzing) [Gammaproteobacteria bacterium]|nr:MAG: asparagine synthase (glutamine-hydrolyzing) [Gammaproteobacteria bacterium]
MSVLLGLVSFGGENCLSRHALDKTLSACGMDPRQLQLTLSENATVLVTTEKSAELGCISEAGITVIVSGRPHIPGKERHGETSIRDFASWLARQYLDHDAKALHGLRGSYAIVIADEKRRRLLLSTDRIGMQNLYFARSGQHVLFSTSLSRLICHPDVNREHDLQALYDYLYFHFIPAPKTIYAGVERVLPGHCALFDGSGMRQEICNHLHYEADPAFEFKTYKDKLSEHIKSAVHSDIGEENRCGAFLSGGVDSSTVCGALAGLTDTPVHAYSIGFDQEGFDEISYARTVAAHFGLKHHVYYVTPEDIRDALPQLAAACDLPFGNSSIIPSYYCAKIARENGEQILLAGDGGDELFAGNYRYAKQLVFQHYHRLPQTLRRYVFETLVDLVPSALDKGPLGKLCSYVRQAQLPLPERMETYNLLEWFGAEQVLNPDLLGKIDRNGPLAQLRQVFNGADADNILNRMLALDMKFTIADNDLVKVNTAGSLAGIDIRYPLLDDNVVDLSLTLPASQKIHGSKLRYFFKNAVSDVLPEETIKKTKHGFGLPFGHWVSTNPALKELVFESLASLKQRDFIRPDFIDRLVSSHLQEHPGYFGTMIWVFVMLELWLESHQVHNS